MITIKRIFIISLAGVLASCGTVRDHRILSHPENRPLTASVGSTLVRIDRQSDLPNAFGARDIYGGKVDRGFAEVKLVGISGSSIKLRVVDHHKNSSDTTMSRYGKKSYIDIQQNVTIDTQSRNGVIATINTSVENTYSVDGVVIEFLKVRHSSVDYRIRKNP